MAPGAESTVTQTSIIEKRSGALVGKEPRSHKRSSLVIKKQGSLVKEHKRKKKNLNNSSTYIGNCLIYPINKKQM